MIRRYVWFDYNRWWPCWHAQAGKGGEEGGITSWNFRFLPSLLTYGFLACLPSTHVDCFSSRRRLALVAAANLRFTLCHSRHCHRYLPVAEEIHYISGQNFYTLLDPEVCRRQSHCVCVCASEWLTVIIAIWPRMTKKSFRSRKSNDFCFACLGLTLSAVGITCRTVDRRKYIYSECQKVRMCCCFPLWRKTPPFFGSLWQSLLLLDCLKSVACVWAF